MTTKQFDIVIIGSGIAGLSAAISLASKGLKLAIFSRESELKISNTYYAQGGIVYPGIDDNTLIDDIFRASAGTSNIQAAKIVVKKSRKLLKDLLLDKARVPFDLEKNGDFNFTKEAAHSSNRILHSGDYTGKSIQEALLNYLRDKKRFPNVSFYSQHTAIDLLTPGHHGVCIQQRYEEDRVLGCYVLNQCNGEVSKVVSKITILACGGFSAIYLHHTNIEGARGDGMAMAKRAGAALTNMEFVQFHPTTFFDRSNHSRFLISEAVRGEGGVLLNSFGKRFMEDYHPQGELAPRDVVARAIVNEIMKTKHFCVYLDITTKKSNWIKDRFPTIYKKCLDRKVDIAQGPIPVIPAAHYSCGGIKTDLTGKTNLKNLYAIGEVACTGLHGANRLASTSLLEGLTWGTIASNDILANFNKYRYYDPNMIADWKLSNFDKADPALIHQDWLTLKQTMWNYVGVERSKSLLDRGEFILSELYKQVHNFYRNATLRDDLLGLRNAVQIGYMVLHASRINSKSVGCFYRKD